MSLLDLLGLNRIFKAGVEVKPTRKILNFIGTGVTIVDDEANDRTNITIAAGEAEGGVTGPGSSVAGRVATWAGTGGDELADGGVALADLATEQYVDDAIAAIPGGGDVVGPASAVDGRLAAFDGTSGELIEDSGIATTAVSSAIASVADHETRIDVLEAAPAGAGWATYCDLNLSQMANQSFPTNGDVTIGGVTFQAGNVAAGHQSVSIVNGQGLKFVATSTTNTFWYGSGHAAAYIGIDLDRIPGFLLETSEVRIFSEYYLTVGTANYATACFGIGKRLNFSGADFSPMIRHYYDSGNLIRGVFMPYNSSEEAQSFHATPATSVTYNVGLIHFKSPHENIAWYAKVWAGLDTQSNDDVFDDQSSFTLFAKRVEAITASGIPKLKQADKPMAMICGQNGNTAGNTVSTFKRLRIEYKL